MVGINNNQVLNSKTITNAIFDNYYPNGRIVVQNTSFGKNGVSGKTLTSRTLSDAISGDVLYRSPKFAFTFYNKSIGSSLNSLITAGSEATFDSSSNVSIEDPESITNTEEDGKAKATTLKGGAAFTRIIADSIAGKQGGSSFINSGINSIFEDYSSSNSPGASDPPIDHGIAPYDPDSTNPSAGGRMIAFKSQMSEEEKGWIVERGKILKDTGNVNDYSHLTGGFYFEITDSYTNMRSGDGASEYPGLDTSLNTAQVSLDVIQAPQQLAYLSPALIECLIALSGKIKFQGGFGAARWFDKMKNGEIPDGSSLSDHGFGRAFDISLVGQLNGNNYDMENNSGNIEIYRGAMDIILPALNSLPMHLIPDIIVHSTDLATEYGVRVGKDPEDAAIKLKYPNLKYVKFHPDDKHKNHIHISFSSARSGIYTGPGGTFGGAPIGNITDSPSGVNPSTGLIDIPGLGSFPIPSTGSTGGTLNPKFTQLSRTYGTQLIADEIYNLLNITCVPELAAIMTAISQREGNVSSLNADILGDGDWNGDWSYGFLQNNLFGTHGKLEVLVPYPTPIKIHAWKLAAPAWQYFNLSSWEQWKGFIKDNFNQVGLESFTTTARSSSDDRIWYPINQVYMAYRFMCGRDPTYPLPLADRLGANGPEMQHVLTPWGDYGGVPGGPLYGTKFSDAAYVYRNSGKSEEDLKNWIRRYFAFANNGATSKSAPFVEFWLAGKRILRNGTIQEWE